MNGRDSRDNLGDELMWALVYVMWLVLVGAILYAALRVLP